MLFICKEGLKISLNLFRVLDNLFSVPELGIMYLFCDVKDTNCRVCSIEPTECDYAQGREFDLG